MKIIKKQKKSIVIAVLATVIVLGVAGLFFYWNSRSVQHNNDDNAANTSNHTDINYSSPTVEQQNGGESAKKELANQDSAKPGDGLPIELSAFKKNSSTVHVTANISGLVTSEGSCELIIKNDSDTKTLQSGIVAVTDYSTCKGFDVTDLKSGLWQIQINITSGNRSGSSSTSIEI